MSLREKLSQIIQKHTELGAQLSSTQAIDPSVYAKQSKEYSDLNDVVQAIQLYFKLEEEEKNLKEMMNDKSLDADMRTMAQEEYYAVRDQIPQVEDQIKILLLPKDIDDEKNVILEIRAGAGGDEAGLFGAELLRMYERYAMVRGWKFELISSQDTGIGAIREASANISGKGVFARLKFESGVHRVQRVPETESSGRVHTSTATVAVLPEAEEVDIQIEEKDLKIDVYRASGAGGQHVNTTDSAVRITHIPTGTVVAQQSERSQHKNKAKALKILRARIYEVQRLKLAQERSDSRRGQVGTGDRSERIRTYNFPQGRASDHRINLTLYKLDKIMEGEALDDLIDALIAHDQAEKITAADF